MIWTYLGSIISEVSVMNLPSAKEYFELRSKRKDVEFPFWAVWSKPKYKCPKCDGGMCKNLMVLHDDPEEQYEYQCYKCGHKELQPM